ncbi:hypothetical protein Tco_0874867 [Tanacetum coccineum]|uniref:Uncharacterized protein n=1 Tax=Tanacetum coccineum TaxID=301880 RepID=A0ABQ5BMV0_9ASTR
MSSSYQGPERKSQHDPPSHRKGCLNHWGLLCQCLIDYNFCKFSFDYFSGGMVSILTIVIIKSCGFTKGLIVKSQWHLAILHSELDQELFERMSLRVVNRWVEVFNQSSILELPQAGTLCGHDVGITD